MVHLRAREVLLQLPQKIEGVAQARVVETHGRDARALCGDLAAASSTEASGCDLELARSAIANHQPGYRFPHKIFSKHPPQGYICE